MGSHRQQRNWLPLPSGLQSESYLCPPSLPSWEDWLVPVLLLQMLALARPWAGGFISVPLWEGASLCHQDHHPRVHGEHIHGTSSSFSPLTSDQGGKEGESTVENGEVPRQNWHD